MSSRLPQWLKRPIPTLGLTGAVEKSIRDGKLVTVCDEARCPNRGECFSEGTATFMLLGSMCTRSCRYCSVTTGVPLQMGGDECAEILEAVRSLHLKTVVLTMVTRDDLPDGGGEYVGNVVSYLKKHEPHVQVETLVSDLSGNLESVKRILDSGVDCFAHNVEMPKKFFTTLRPKSDYIRSFKLLSYVASITSIPVKTSFMVGLGESKRDVFELLDDCSRYGVDIVTIGQYLQPTSEQIPVKRYVSLEEFEEYKLYGEKNGISCVVAGPYVRSSYRAGIILNKSRADKNESSQRKPFKEASYEYPDYCSSRESNFR